MSTIPKVRAAELSVNIEDIDWPPLLRLVPGKGLLFTTTFLVAG